MSREIYDYSSHNFYEIDAADIADDGLIFIDITAAPTVIIGSALPVITPEPCPPS